MNTKTRVRGIPFDFKAAIACAKTSADLAAFHVDGEDKAAAAEMLRHAIDNLGQAMQMLVEES